MVTGVDRDIKKNRHPCRRPIRILVAALLTGLVRACTVTPALAAEPSPCLQAYHLLAGQVAPCDGDELPTAEVLRLLLAEDTRDQLQLTLLAEKAERVNDTMLALGRWKSENAARLACEAEHAAPCVCQAQAWYRSWTFGLVVGVAVGAGVAAGVAYALR